MRAIGKERYGVFVMLLPTLLVLAPLFGGSLLYGFFQSLGWQPLLGRTEFSLDAYADLLFASSYAPKFWEAVGFSLWVSLASTALSALLAVALALAIARSSLGRSLSSFFLQFSLPIPHLVAALGALFLLSQSGLVSRAMRLAGLIATPAEFPALVRDRGGIGVILAYLWKEVPFMGLVTLAALSQAGSEHDDSARTLGASPWQRFRYVTLPLIAPSLAASAILVFSYVFGAYEIPSIVGVRNPQSLPVMSLELFVSPDLRDRAAAMALGVIMALLVLLLVMAYLALLKRGAQAREDPGL
jgi:putative spermidine/putrescine transport system permease protein